MRHSGLMATALPILVGLALWAGGGVASRAAEGRSFVIAANDGYGVDDCLGEANDCGHEVADAWCATHGHGPAIAFGRADDVTGSIASRGPSIVDRPYVVTCGE